MHHTVEEVVILFSQRGKDVVCDYIQGLHERTQRFYITIIRIDCLISLTYVAEVRQILTIQFYCKRLSNCIKAL